MAQVITTLVFTEVPEWIRDQPAGSVHAAVKRTLNPLASTKFISCPDFENLRVEFYSWEEANYIKECFDNIEMEIKMKFSEFNLSSQQKKQPEVSFSVISRDVYRFKTTGSLLVPHARDPPWFNRHFPSQEEVGRDYYFS